MINKSPEDILHNDPALLDTFSVIIATNLHDEETLLLSDICQKSAKTLVSVRCKGFCSLFRVQAPEHHSKHPNLLRYTHLMILQSSNPTPRMWLICVSVRLLLPCVTMPKRTTLTHSTRQTTVTFLLSLS